MTSVHTASGFSRLRTELLALPTRFDDAKRYARESQALAADVRDRSGRVFGVGRARMRRDGARQLERAGRLWGAIGDERAFAPLGGWQRHRDERYARIRKLATRRSPPRALELDAAVKYALAET